MTPKHLMRMNELVRRSGLPRTTIHFYLRQGLLPPPVKTGRTMAYYDQSHLSRLRTIRKLKGDGRVPVAFLKQRLDEVDQRVSAGLALERGPLESEHPSDGPTEGKREQIMEAAIQVFSAQGYHQTKVRDITRAAGISTGTFYIYFKNKRALFVDVVDRVIHTIIGDGADAIRREKDIDRRLKVRGEVFYNNYNQYNEILHQLRAEIVGREAWAGQKVKKAYQDLTEPLVRDLRRAKSREGYRDVDPELLAYALTGIIEIMSLRTTIDDKYTFEQIMDFIHDFATYGLLARPGDPPADPPADPKA